MFGALLALDDSGADIWQLHARMLHATGRRELALLSIARALALQPERGSYHLTHGAILSASQRYAAAQLAYERAVQLEPRHPGSYTNLGSLLDLIGQPDAALDNYAQALALDPDYAQAHWNRSLVYLRRGDYERGWREYEWRWKTTTAGVLKCGRGFSRPVQAGCEKPFCCTPSRDWATCCSSAAMRRWWRSAARASCWKCRRRWPGCWPRWRAWRASSSRVRPCRRSTITFP